MKQLSRDVKSILTKTAFQIPPHLIGKSLATPKRRLAAFLLDFLIASILFKAVGSGLYAVIGVLLIIPTFIKQVKLKLKRRTRIFLFIVGVIMLLSVGVNTIKNQVNENFVNPLVNGEFDSAEDSLVVSKVMDKISKKIDADTTGAVRNVLENLEINNLDVGQVLGLESDDNIDFDSMNVKIVEDFYVAFKSKDSTAMSNARKPMIKLVAGKKIVYLKDEIDSLDTQVEDLEDKVDELEEQLEEPSFTYIVKATINDIGFSLGWFAFYTIFCWLLFDGSSPGKRLFHIKIIRMNGHDLKLWYCFERFSGYAAGVATGLLGFMQIYWDDNRQCIHDKIASTVVIDLKPKRKRQSK